MIPMRFAELLNEPHIDVLVGELEDKVQPLMPYSDDTCNFFGHCLKAAFIRSSR